MDTYSIFKTVFILGGVLVLMIALLYFFRFFMSRFSSTKALLSSSSITVIHRTMIDPKRQILELKDGKNNYTLLLGDHDILLHKEPIANPKVKKESINEA